MERPLGTGTVTQVALVVKDVEAVKQKFARLLGGEAPPTVGSGEFEQTQTQYHGAPAPEAGCKMAFFDIGENLQLELIEPGPAQSIWRDFLESHGEGVHHIALHVKDTDKRLAAAREEFGWGVLQRGRYGDASGEYAYLDSELDLKVCVETLENY